MSRVLIADVVEVVAEWFALSVDELMAPHGERRVTWPRHLAIYLARELTGQSQTAVGRFIGGRDHTTVWRSINLVRRELAAEPDLARAVDQLIADIRERAASRFCARAVLREHIHGRVKEASLHG